MKPDALIKVRFRTQREGGRDQPVPGPSFSCPLVIDGEAFDCRLQHGKGELALGQWHDVKVKFLDRANVARKLSAGTKFKLWEGKDVAEGIVLDVYDAPVQATTPQA
ncbi:hypothetical protein IP92_04325 [Pseudoduganella flava]|uniref:Uncharacterized protein n=1 Tax=Pseudoduganella flava TaxID=871742 RepID=A0A562PK28_9BURK|nr:hypothetical protein [Pseudoduganella flava]QGZ41961.1 hypothetical protein GO485_24865 [Pseudoduganella flava]TWI44376.1 hypothetical protein IP92_04325 [Pseudoduganella flava]